MIWKNGPILRTKFQRRDFRALGGGACGRSRAAAAISRAPSRRAEPGASPRLGGWAGASEEWEVLGGRPDGREGSWWSRSRRAGARGVRWC
jgi:hypothetical protein